ncbi:MAG: FAD-dependent oxidoreductase [Gemmatimonadales bacterium]|nr:MAG: FAD-dependent oxidoreductase [Gemmatimonadales bacterium]
MDLLPRLPGHLQPRVRVISPGAQGPIAGGSFVLYWMRTAVRGHENPALDAGLEAARALGLPLFVYHALSERYPFASDRHHTFILEGARDVAQELARRGIGYAFHLERPGHRGPHLLTLAGQAALVITEEMPVPFLTRWTQRLAASVSTPVWAVDADLLAPLGRIPAAATHRAFRFRAATETLRVRWMQEPWPDAEPAPVGGEPAPAGGGGAPFLPPLPFEPVELATASVPELVAACEIDHGVGPVPHTPGGSRAGYRRWEAFRDGDLGSYHRRRNNPLQAGVSRLSPYLHYGHVSPFRVAREAASAAREGSKGAEKFLDELLIWRELAHAFAFHAPELESLAALPRWARETLASHAGDPRPKLLTWERLARARSEDPLWDAAQRSLLIHGELHNNVRMTWGKAVPFWTESPEAALTTLIDLNHRYALDGRDPNSYGGILWSLGGLDRPFPGDRPVLGTVRPRSTTQHAARLDVARWSERTRRPALSHPPRIAVVGAGVAGLSAARVLSDHGLEVTVVDKGRGPGGRISTRESSQGWSMDHGAQYFTARDPVFRNHLASWEAEGVVARWEGRFVRDAGGSLEPARSEERWVGTPGMRALALHLAEGLEVHTGLRVTELMAATEEGGWLEGMDDPRGAPPRTLRDAPRGAPPGRWILRALNEGSPGSTPQLMGPFDAVLLTPPAPQTLELLSGRMPTIEARLGEARLRPCLAGMLRVGRRIELPLEGAFLPGPILSWIARDSSKPDRSREGGESWVLHGGPDWSEMALEWDRDAVADALLAAFQEVVDQWGDGATIQPEVLQVHRWRYALPDPALPERALWDPATGIGVAGDALGGPRVEGAFLSGRALAGRLLGSPPEVEPGVEPGVDGPGRGRPKGGPPYPDAQDELPEAGAAEQLDLLS